MTVAKEEVEKKEKHRTRKVQKPEVEEVVPPAFKHDNIHVISPPQICTTKHMLLTAHKHVGFKHGRTDCEDAAGADFDSGAIGAALPSDAPVGGGRAGGTGWIHMDSTSVHTISHHIHPPQHKQQTQRHAIPCHIISGHKTASIKQYHHAFPYTMQHHKNTNDVYTIPYHSMSYNGINSCLTL